MSGSGEERNGSVVSAEQSQRRSQGAPRITSASARRVEECTAFATRGLGHSSLVDDPDRWYVAACPWSCPLCHGLLTLELPPSSKELLAPVDVELMMGQIQVVVFGVDRSTS